VVTFTDDGGRLRAGWQDQHGRETELLRYVYRPPEAQLESPRPYFHPLRTLRGDPVSRYRPHDHVWHKGISWSLPNVGSANFWGGPTYQRGHGYRQLPNNGRMRHDRFGPPRPGSSGRLTEELSWLTEDGETWFTERREIGVLVLADISTWVLTFGTAMRNVSGRSIAIGSPTTEGRENAGYGGLFWRGPRSFTGGRVIGPDGEGGDGYMGRRGPWLAFTGQHDGHGRSSTVLMADCPGNFSYPSQWFVRSQPFACLCPAPFFAAERTLASGDTLELRYRAAIADGALDRAACQALADRLAADEAAVTAGTP
jgi:hypothetical protein